MVSRISYDLLIKSLISARQIPIIYQSIQNGTHICRNPDVLGGQFYTRLRYSFGFLNEMHILQKIRNADSIALAFGKLFWKIYHFHKLIYLLYQLYHAPYIIYDIWYTAILCGFELFQRWFIHIEFHQYFIFEAEKLQIVDYHMSNMKSKIEFEYSFFRIARFIMI